jgi:hypothetical protein
VTKTVTVTVTDVARAITPYFLAVSLREKHGASLAARGTKMRISLVLVLTTASVFFVGCVEEEPFSSPTSPEETPSSPTPDTPSDPESDPAAAYPKLPSAKAKQVVVGGLHACALTTEGAVRCWGYTELGQLGNGIVDNKPKTAIPVPVAVIGLDSGVKQISTYSSTTCALTAAGGVKCWGEDDLGQLGTGIPYVDTRKKVSAVPVDVKGLSSGVRAISVGLTSACAITAAGGVKCWGQDEYGKLGNASTHTSGDGAPDFQPPVDVVGLSGIKEISVGRWHACALSEAGVLKCWGRNGSELGIPKDGAGSKGEPVEVTSLGNNVAHVYAADKMTCVIMKDTSAKCWGDGSKGQLGDGQDGILRYVYEPVDVVGLTNVTAISNGGEYTCAIAQGAVKCWGTGEIGHQGEGYFASFVPIQALDLTSGWTSVATSGRFNCVISSENAVKCWGDNGAGTLGDGKGGVTGLERSDTLVGVVSLP